MNRRQLVQYVVGTFIPIAGCGGDYSRGDPPTRELEIRIQEVLPIEDTFQLTVEIIFGRAPQVTFEDVALLAYSELGKLICHESVSDRTRTEVEVTCSAFPAIITADAATSVCEDVRIPISYWVGTDEQQHKHIPDELPEDAIVYDTTTRECGESLPPERFVNESESTNTDE